MGERPRLRVGIVGAGASGTLLAVHLARRMGDRVAIALFERSSVFGLGVAYATSRPEHTLNVPAYLMGGVDAADEDGFLRFAAPRIPGASVVSIRADYLPRGLYGDYLRTLLEGVFDTKATCDLVADEVTRIETRADGSFRLHTASGAWRTVDAVALCLGNLPPPPLSRTAHPRVIEDPWRADALSAIGADDRIAMVGTGLTMVDVVLELLDRGFGGEIVAISRHGLFPLADALGPAYPDFFDPSIADRGILAVSRALRAEVRDAASQGVSWHTVVDAFRVHASTIWGRLDPVNRRRFIRHLRSIWLVYRHRLPPQHVQRLATLRDAGRLRVLRGRVSAVASSETGVAVEMRTHGSPDARPTTFDALVNCTGPQGDYSRSGMPLIRSLLADGLARPDPLRLGLDVDSAMRVVGTDGMPRPGLVSVGPPTRGRFWEVTAVPHLRRQIETLVDGMAEWHARC